MSVNAHGVAPLRDTDGVRETLPRRRSPPVGRRVQIQDDAVIVRGSSRGIATP